MTPLLLAIALLQPPAIDRTVAEDERKAIYAALANNLANPTWYDPALTAAARAAQDDSAAPAVVWSVASGTLPPGVSLLPDGRLTGTPTAAGTFSFTVRATTTLVGVIERAFTVTIQPGVEIDATPPPVGTVGQAYQHQFQTKTQETLQ